MIVLGILLGFAIIVLFMAYVTLNYKNHCIEDLELTNKHLRETKNFEIANVLLDIIEYTEPRKSYRMMDIRDYCDKKMEELAQKNRTSQDHESND